MQVQTTCPFCGTKNKPIEVNDDHYKAWQDGVLIQNAMPELTREEREIVKTGICGECWSNM